MPGTWKAFLQGLGSAMPQVVQLMEANKQYDLEQQRVALLDRQVGLQGEQVAIQGRAQDLAEKKAVAETAYTQAQADDITRSWAIDDEIKQINKDIMALQRDRGDMENADYRRETDLRWKEIETRTDKALAEVTNIGARTKNEYLQGYATTLGMLLNATQVSVQLGLNPGILDAVMNAKDIPSAFAELGKANIDARVKANIQGWLIPAANAYTELIGQHSMMMGNFMAEGKDAEEARAMADAIVGPKLKQYESIWGMSFGLGQEEEPPPGGDGEPRGSSFFPGGVKNPSSTQALGRAGRGVVGYLNALPGAAPPYAPGLGGQLPGQSSLYPIPQY